MTIHRSLQPPLAVFGPRVAHPHGATRDIT